MGFPVVEWIFRPLTFWMKGKKQDESLWFWFLGGARVILSVKETLSNGEFMTVLPANGKAHTR